MVNKENNQQSEAEVHARIKAVLLKAGVSEEDCANLNLNDVEETRTAIRLARARARTLEEDDDPGGDNIRPWAVTEHTLRMIDKMSPTQLEDLIDNLAGLEHWNGLRERARQRAQQWLGAIKKADEAPRCEFVKLDGQTCGSPAVKGQTLCYYHGQARNKPTPEDSGNLLDLSSLEDRMSVQLAILRVCNQLAAKSIDEKTGRAIVSALRLAERNLGQKSSLL